ncbi:MAG: hypothetical protein J7M25_11980 [Deltaproteobacteria bacterium]|nr:hypothetical protein [Deltaproteobacteria bacterium]
MPDIFMDEQLFLAVAKALYSTRLHLLTLTEVVRNNIQPDEDGHLLLPAQLETEMKDLAFDFLLAMFPIEFHGLLESERGSWMSPQ